MRSKGNLLEGFWDWLINSQNETQCPLHTSVYFCCLELRHLSCQWPEDEGNTRTEQREENFESLMTSLSRWINPGCAYLQTSCNWRVKKFFLCLSHLSNVFCILGCIMYSRIIVTIVIIIIIIISNKHQLDHLAVVNRAALMDGAWEEKVEAYHFSMGDMLQVLFWTSA